MFMLKRILALALVIAILLVAGCCCCTGANRYSYSTVGRENASACPSCATPYDGLYGPGSTAYARGK